MQESSCIRRINYPFTSVPYHTFAKSARGAARGGKLFYALTDSYSSTISFSGAGVSRLTATMKIPDTKNAGSSS